MDDLNIFERHKKIQELNKISENLINDILHSFDEISDDIFKQKDNTIALAFAKDIGKLLRDNGVVPHLTEYINHPTQDNAYAEYYGVVFDSIDFSEHDKSFQEEIDKLKSDISNIKSRCVMSAVNDFKNGNYGALKVVRAADYEASKKMYNILCDENARLNRENEKLMEDNKADVTQKEKKVKDLLFDLRKMFMDTTDEAYALFIRGMLKGIQDCRNIYEGKDTVDSSDDIFKNYKSSIADAGRGNLICYCSKTPIRDLENEISKYKEEINKIKKLNDECCEENIRLTSENKELHRELQETALSDNLPWKPIEVAQMLITAKATYETNDLEKSMGMGEIGELDKYNISALRQIAEHLLVYCNNNKEDE